ncbi:hypothetical protein FMEAI12_3460016 [Parafrankia sp. Ea1.12]|nr:hypothetical protein FMEAI12_3460016 [Parafrankia sp. Ea1.12]
MVGTPANSPAADTYTTLWPTRLPQFVLAASRWIWALTWEDRYGGIAARVPTA